MSPLAKDCLRSLASVGAGVPLWINRVVESGVCPVTGGQLYVSATRVREACQELISRGLIEADGLQTWTAAVWITEKGLKKAASYEEATPVSFKIG